jgi:uncharacterized coiled-coil protein SlyX
MAAAQQFEDIRETVASHQEITLMELVAAVAETADNDAEVAAVIQHLINTGKVQLVGSFLGADVRVV